MPGTLPATNNAQTLLASTVVTPGTSAVFGAAAIGQGVGTLSSGLTNGVPVTSLSVTALTGAIAAGTSVTLIYQTHSATVTAPVGAAVGATSITINSFTPSFSFPSGTGLVRTPLASDTALDSEVTRAPLAFPGSGSGSIISPLLIIPFTIAGDGRVTITAYFPPTVASGTYFEVGFYADATASTTLGSGTLVFRSPVYWSHTLNNDSFTAKLDTFLIQL
jgi:hypothetical protein